MTAFTVLASNAQIVAEGRNGVPPEESQAAGPAPSKAPDSPSNAAGPAGNPAPAAAPDAFVPMTNRQKLAWTVGCVVEPRWILYSGLTAGLDQWRNSPPQWSQGAKGYARRFGAAHTLEAFEDTVWFAGVALRHEDVRYVRSARSGFLPRMADALKLGLLSRRDNGSIGFAYARTVSGLGTDLLARALYPDRKPFTAGAMLLSALRYVAVREALSVVREFLPDILKRRASAAGNLGIPAPATTRPQPPPGAGVPAPMPPQP
jgi:hypothetical protein